ncbi:hypothetical protein L6R29_20675 [Myxococcota bacterium]|jgi:hypothetical protein|nr:hypothetical protein [Myxococcota bacterium]
MKRISEMMPSVGAVLVQTSFGIGEAFHRLFEVIEVRPLQLCARLREIPSAAHPEPQGPPFWVSLEGSDPVGIFTMKEETP